MSLLTMTIIHHADILYTVEDICAVYLIISLDPIRKFGYLADIQEQLLNP